MIANVRAHTHTCTNTRTHIHTQAERNSELALQKAEEEERLATVLSRRQHEADRSQREVQQLREQSEELRA